jgi:hypothetical protein
MIILERIWNDVRKGENIYLYLTIVIAIGLSILNLFGLAPDTMVASLTLAVLGLLAITSLVNRYQIEEQLNKIGQQSSHFLRERSQLPSFHERGQSATEIVIVGVSAITAITPHLDFFEQKMRTGATLRFLLLDPENPSAQVFNLISKVPDVQADIKQTLKSLNLLILMEQKFDGKCLVRLSDVFLPFGLAAFDPGKDIGFMNIEMYAYKKTLGERPHFVLTQGKDKKWFDYYKSQYEQLWKNSKAWKPL